MINAIHDLFQTFWQLINEHPGTVFITIFVLFFMAVALKDAHNSR